MVQGATGLGFALLSIPFFLLILDSVEGVQVAMALSMTICAAVAIPLWKHTPRRTWALLVVGSVIGFPLGLFLFASGSLSAIKLAAAIAIMTFAVATALLRLRQDPREVNAASTASASLLAIGVISGAMTTGLGMPGPPVALYLAWKGVGKQTLRALALTLFPISYVGALSLQAATVGVSLRVWMLYGLLLPFAGIGAYAGHRMSRLIPEGVFRSVVLLLMFGTGGYMLLVMLLG